MMSVIYRDLSYGLSIVMFVFGSADWKNIWDGSSISRAWLIRKACQTIPSDGESGMFL